MNKPWRLTPSEYARINRLIKHKDDCWEWQGPQTPNGYGKHKAGPGKPERVIHRILWEHHNDQPVPDGLQLDHRCFNRVCCNPEHLEPVTASENTKRQRHYNRGKEECPNGHVYDEANTRITPAGKRACRACDRERTVKKRRENGEAPATRGIGDGGGDSGGSVALSPTGDDG